MLAQGGGVGSKRATYLDADAEGEGDGAYDEENGDGVKKDAATS